MQLNLPPPKQPIAKDRRGPSQAKGNIELIGGNLTFVDPMNQAAGQRTVVNENNVPIAISQESVEMICAGLTEPVGAFIQFAKLCQYGQRLPPQDQQGILSNIENGVHALSGCSTTSCRSTRPMRKCCNLDGSQ